MRRAVCASNGDFLTRFENPCAPKNHSWMYVVGSAVCDDHPDSFIPAIRVFLHRMIVCMGENVLQYMPTAISELLSSDRCQVWRKKYNNLFLLNDHTCTHAHMHTHTTYFYLMSCIIAWGSGRVHPTHWPNDCEVQAADCACVVAALHALHSRRVCHSSISLLLRCCWWGLTSQEIDPADMQARIEIGDVCILLIITIMIANSMVAVEEGVFHLHSLHCERGSLRCSVLCWKPALT